VLWIERIKRIPSIRWHGSNLQNERPNKLPDQFANFHRMKPIIEWEQFEQVQMQVGRVLSVEPFPEARSPAFIITVDFGQDRGVLKTSAQLTERYLPSELHGKLVVGVTNFPKKQVGPMMSEFLILGALDTTAGTAIIQVHEDVPLGTSIA
jgi:tRNA-binding protein